MKRSNSIFLLARDVVTEVHGCKIIKDISQTTKREENDLLVLNHWVFCRGNQMCLEISNGDFRKGRL